ncbi:hypothetical protein [Deinococcus sp. QL22]|uniref:hypothetical protein n=1 Tax=Deinococcus sp. QL22 TaxID=2939437 RepID=UPI0020176DFE|nr:hypothetical protein [Deinococcus sp. QL22]UQN05438.1 hypothetical protein M1R55_11190 [Deinococcus sp. QL22]
MAASSFSFPNNASSAALIMSKLHELLIAKGWEIQWANAAAIGTGTAANPKWDTTPAVSTSAGIASYLMPLAGLTNRWVVTVEMAWAAGSVLIPLFYSTTAQSVSTSTGVMTGAGRRNGGSFGQFNAGQAHVTVSEYGFAFTNAGLWHGVERRRQITNTYSDDLTSHQFSTAGNVGFANGARNLCRNWTTGEYGEDALAFLGTYATTALTSGDNIATLSSGDGNVGFPAGPITTSNGLGGVLRHVQCFRPNDSVVGIDQAITVDGQTRLYLPTVGAGPGTLRVLIARQ